MTFDELYEYGMQSEPAKACIPKELVQSLPRLERIHGRVVVQYWYYFYNVSYPGCCIGPLYYAAYDLQENKLVELKALTDRHEFMQSWQDLIFWSRNMREVRYLEYCGSLLERGNITEKEIIHSQALWLDAQAKDIFPELHHSSGVRPEAVEELLSPQMAERSRYLIWLWSLECDKYRMGKKEGYEKLEPIWNDPTFLEESDVYWDLLVRGPSMGSRTKKDF